MRVCAHRASCNRPPALCTGRSAYLWGYLNQTRSSRRLESECKRNLEVLWLMRKLQPDFKTIADFRKDNAKAFKMVFRQFSLLCRELDLFGRELIAIDGTKLKAVNNPARNLSAEQLRGSLSASMRGWRNFCKHWISPTAKNRQRNLPREDARRLRIRSKRCVSASSNASKRCRKWRKAVQGISR